MLEWNHLSLRARITGVLLLFVLMSGGALALMATASPVDKLMLLGGLLCALCILLFPQTFNMPMNATFFGADNFKKLPLASKVVGTLGLACILLSMALGLLR